MYFQVQKEMKDFVYVLKGKNQITQHQFQDYEKRRRRFCMNLQMIMIMQNCPGE